MSPTTRERLEKTLARAAHEHGLDQERLHRWMSFLALCGVLERAIHDGILTRYYLKCGVAMELRLAGVPRATKDLDLRLDGDRTHRLSSFASALQLGFDEFTFRLRSQTRHMELDDTVPVEVIAVGKLNYAQTRVAVERVFKERAAHPVPGAFVFPGAWRFELESLALQDC